MKNQEIFIGSFVRLKSPDYLKGVVSETVSYHGNALMFFLGSPQRYGNINQSKLEREVFHQSLKENKIALSNVVVHLSYLINLANVSNHLVFQRSINLMKKTLQLCQYLNITKVVLHPGSALKNNPQIALEKIVFGLDEILDDFPNIMICLETMSGKGSELGKNFDELQFIIKRSKYHQQLAVCFDLCHLYSAGYDLVKDWEAILKEFDEKIGLKKLLVCHVNDSKTFFNSRRDRHENIGMGTIGLETIKKIIHHPQMMGKTMILETPYLNKEPQYKQEIALLLNQEDEK